MSKAQLLLQDKRQHKLIILFVMIILSMRMWRKLSFISSRMIFYSMLHLARFECLCYPIVTINLSYIKLEHIEDWFIKNRIRCKLQSCVWNCSDLEKQEVAKSYKIDREGFQIYGNQCHRNFSVVSSDNWLRYSLRAFSSRTSGIFHTVCVTSLVEIQGHLNQTIVQFLTHTN